MYQYAKLCSEGSLVEIVILRDQPEGIRTHPSGVPALVPYVERDRPPFDPETQKLFGPIDELTNGALVRRWEVIELTAEEIAARDRLAALSDPVLAEVARELLNRVRALEGKPPMTDEQFITWLAERAKRGRAMNGGFNGKRTAELG